MLGGNLVVALCIQSEGERAACVFCTWLAVDPTSCLSFSSSSFSSSIVVPDCSLEQPLPSFVPVERKIDR